MRPNSSQSDPSNSERGKPASEDLLPLVYDELRRLAAFRMAGEGRGKQSMQATALVHEAWLRLANGRDHDWHGRTHFFNVAGEAMRRILVDRARRRKAAKRGGGLEPVELDDVELAENRSDDLILEMHDALETLSRENHEATQVVKLRFFVGMRTEEAAQVLGVSDKTVRRRWQVAKTRLYQIIKASKNA